jgi:hypothetical protein
MHRSCVNEVQEFGANSPKRLNHTGNNLLASPRRVTVSLVVFTSACSVPGFQTGLTSIPVGEWIASRNIDKVLRTAREVSNHVQDSIGRMCSLNGVMVIRVTREGEVNCGTKFWHRNLGLWGSAHVLGNLDYLRRQRLMQQGNTSPNFARKKVRSGKGKAACASSCTIVLARLGCRKCNA